MRRMERLNRGLIVAALEKGMYLSWRYLGDEAPLPARRSDVCFR